MTPIPCAASGEGTGEEVKVSSSLEIFKTSWTTQSSWSCWSRGIILNDLQRCLPTTATFWVCDCLNLKKRQKCWYFKGPKNGWTRISLENEGELYRIRETFCYSISNWNNGVENYVLFKEDCSTGKSRSVKWFTDCKGISDKVGRNHLFGNWNWVIGTE